MTTIYNRQSAVALCSLFRQTVSAWVTFIMSSNVTCVNFPCDHFQSTCCRLYLLSGYWHPAHIPLRTVLVFPKNIQLPQSLDPLCLAASAVKIPAVAEALGSALTSLCPFDSHSCNFCLLVLPWFLASVTLSEMTSSVKLTTT